MNTFNFQSFENLIGPDCKEVMLCGESDSKHLNLKSIIESKKEGVDSTYKVFDSALNFQESNVSKDPLARRFSNVSKREIERVLDEKEIGEEKDENQANKNALADMIYENYRRYRESEKNKTKPIYVPIIFCVKVGPQDVSKKDDPNTNSENKEIKRCYKLIHDFINSDDPNLQKLGELAKETIKFVNVNEKKDSITLEPIEAVWDHPEWEKESAPADFTEFRVALKSKLDLLDLQEFNDSVKLLFGKTPSLENGQTLDEKLTKMALYVAKQWKEAHPKENVIDLNYQKEILVEYLKIMLKNGSEYVYGGTLQYCMQNLLHLTEAYSKKTILDFCHSYPDHFSSNMGLGFDLLLFRQDPINVSCLKTLLEKHFPINVIDDWIYCSQGAINPPGSNYMNKLFSLIDKGVPNEWVDHTFNLLSFLEGIRISKKTLAKLMTDPNELDIPFIQLYFTELTEEIYNSDDCEKNFPLKECEPFANQHVVRKENFAKDAGYGDQTKYGAYVHQTILNGAKFLKEKDWGFDQLLAFLMIRRQQIGKGKPYGIPQSIGKNLYTHCRTIYKNLGENLSSLLKSKSSFVEEKKNEHETDYQLKAPLRGEMISHSLINIDNEGRVIIFHTKEKDVIQKILKGVAKLFDEARAERDDNKFIEKIALTYWWICQAKPWNLGDPSIAEMLIKTLCLERGQPLPAWKKGVVPWEKVMECFDPDDFVAQFPTFFEEEYKAGA